MISLHYSWCQETLLLALLPRRGKKPNLKRRKRPHLPRSKQSSVLPFPPPPFLSCKRPNPRHQLRGSAIRKSPDAQPRRSATLRRGVRRWRWCRRWPSTSSCSWATRRWARRPSSPASCTTSSTTPTRSVRPPIFGSLLSPSRLVCAFRQDQRY